MGEPATDDGTPREAESRRMRAQAIAEHVARELAEDMAVDDYRVEVTFDPSAPLGSAVATPEDRLITIDRTTVEHPNEALLRATLAHELAHLVLGVPWWDRQRDALRAGFFAAFLVIGVLTTQVLNTDASRWLVTVLWVMFICVIGSVAERMGHDVALRRLELECDVVAAHATGLDGLQLLPYDPTQRMSRFERLFCTHPSPQKRWAAVLEHGQPEGCACARGSNRQS